MLYDISLRIRYDYAQPTNPGTQILRLMPGDIYGVQRMIAGRMEVSPRPLERRDRLDFYRTPTTELRFGPAEKFIEFRVTARVERLARPPELDFSPPLARLQEEVAADRSLAFDAPHHFLGPSPRIRPRSGMTSYAEAAIAPGMTTQEIMLAVGNALYRDMAFETDATTVDTRPEDAFERRAGVCQDFAQVMIACLRGLGVPAGYVSGYLRTEPPPGQMRLEGADAMHAWVAVWCGVEVGWVEYDPTNAVLVGQDHITIGPGRDYSDVVPVQGVLRTAGGQSSLQEVTVEPLG